MAKRNKSTIFLSGLFLVFALIILVLFVITINNEVAENRQSKRKLSHLTKEVALLEKQVASQSEHYHRLLTDEEFVRRRIKQKFEYTYPDEIVFKFKEGALTPSEPIPTKE